MATTEIHKFQPTLIDVHLSYFTLTLEMIEPTGKKIQKMEICLIPRWLKR